MSDDLCASLAGGGVSFRSDYVQTVLDPSEMRRRSDDLSGVDFDCIVGTGLSGLLPLQILAEHLNCNYLAVRKPLDSSHSDSLLEGTLGARWVFVDDFISSGSTLVRVQAAIDAAASEAHFVTVCVGAWCYDELDFNRWRSLPTLRAAYPLIDYSYDYRKKKF